MLRRDADKLRSYNSDFLILHYRLGAGLGYRSIAGACNPSGDYLHIIEGNQWVQEWPSASTVKERWFFHWPVAGTVRVLNCDWGWYLMELNDAAYRTYWQAEVLRQLQANDDDGLFLDSISVPNYLGADRYDPALPAIDATFEAGWATRIEDWLAWIQTQPIGKYVILPNAGSWITTRDPTDYSAADGVMIEGFALWGFGDYFAEEDWRLQMNRVLELVSRNKILIAQSYGSDVNERLFATASYLLIRGRHTYLNLDIGLEPEWWPEYEVKLLAAQESAGDDIDNLRTSNGVYVRSFEGGFVAVNPANSGPALPVALGSGLIGWCSRWAAVRCLPVGRRPGI
ncbi:MAG: hypothetical protein IPK16_11015 [Anaerolineales bacterium]|nr:hypothetical protein [Anaerolineales bacterium]